jgi:ABC-type multidrug transport system ATPase subunit
MTQLDAVVALRRKLASRYYISTCVARFTPPLLMLFLIIGYLHSWEADLDSRTYSNMVIRLPWTGYMGVDPDLISPRGLTHLALFSGPLPVVPIGNYLDVSRFTRESQFVRNETQLKEFGTQVAGIFSQALTLGTLHVSPSTPLTRALMEYMRKLDPEFGPHVRLRMHADEDSALKFIEATRRTNRTWALLHFRAFNSSAVDYSIRLDNFALPPTQKVDDAQQIGFDNTFALYHTSGFLSIQKMVDDFIFDHAVRTGAARPDARPPASRGLLLTPMPTAGYHYRSFFRQYGQTYSLVLTISLLVPIALLVKTIVHEKQEKLAFSMRMAGLPMRTHLLGWLRHALTEFTTVAVFLTLCSAAFMRRTSAALLFVQIVAYCYGALAFAFLVSTLFNHGVLAACAAPVFFLAAILPHYLFLKFNTADAHPGSIRLAGFSAPAAFGFLADDLIAREANELGISFTEFLFAVSGESQRRWLGCLLRDTALYALLGLYLEHVWPLQYGRREHPLYLLSPSFWRGHRSESARRHMPIHRTPGRDPTTHEAVSAEVATRASIELGGLAKEFHTATERKHAVRGLNLTLYEGHISCVLGHNGAGKTTTLSMLTGLLTPTEGDCLIFGTSVRDEPHRCHEVLGLCMQHDVLWPVLTVRDHLELYAELKGVPAPLVSNEARRVADDVGLVDKLDTSSSQLSGGMQRKLSVGCALIGGSRLVVLDEPSSGLDPVSRTLMWELLRTYREGRVLVLTTHYMDEADLLADRIAILSAGQLIASGSSMFLKNRFGLGYVLTVVREARSAAGAVGGGGGGGGTRTLALSETSSDLVHDHIADAQVLTLSGDEESYRLPASAVHRFSALLRALDEAPNVRTYGMQITTLEEVFIRLASKHSPAGLGKPMAGIAAKGDDDAWTAAGRLPLASSSDVYNTSARRDGRRPLPAFEPSTRRQFNALLHKRFLVALRSPLSFFIQQTLPVAFVYLVLKGVSPSATPVGIQPRPPLAMTAEMFKNRTTCFAGMCKTELASSQLVHTSAVTSDQRDLLRTLNSTFDVNALPAETAGAGAAQDSKALARYLLNTSFEHGGHKRLAALAFNDNVTFGILGDMLQIAQVRAVGERLSQYDLDDAEPDDLVGDVLSTLDFADRDASINVSTLGEAKAFFQRQRQRIDDLRVSGDDCASLGITPLQCERLAVRVDRQRSRHDVNNDGDVDAEDLASAMAMLNDGRVSFAECARLELPRPLRRERCILLMNRTELDWSRRDIDDDGEVDNEDMDRHASMLADFNLTRAECKRLELGRSGCSFYQDLIRRADCRQLHLNSTSCAERTARLNATRAVFDFDGGLRDHQAQTLARVAGLAENYSFTACPFWGSGAWGVSELRDLCWNVDELLAKIWNSSAGVQSWHRDDVKRLAGVVSGLLRAMVATNPNVTERFTKVVRNHTNVTESTYAWHKKTLHVPITLMHNTSSPHAAAAALADLTRAAWIDAHDSNRAHAEAPTYRLTNHPLPPPKTPYLDFGDRKVLSIFLAFFLSIPLSYMPAAAGTLVTTERICRSTHVQLVSGAHASVYWLSHLVADVAAYLLSTALVILLFYVRDERAFVETPEQTFATLVLLVSFGASSIPIMHLFSKGFDSAPTAQIGCIIFNLFTSYGLHLVDSVSLQSHLGMWNWFGHHLVISLHRLYLLFPMFSLSSGLRLLSLSWIKCDYLNDIYGAMHPHLLEACLDPFGYIWGVLIRLPLMPSICWAILLLIDQPTVVRAVLRRMGCLGAHCLCRIDGSYLEGGDDDDHAQLARRGEGLVDDDVKAERRRVASLDRSEERSIPLVIRAMSKTYAARAGGRLAPLRAVQRLDLIVQRGECFGLLGVNGAGKTTTLSVLTGGTVPSAGSAAIDGFDVVDEQQEVFQRIGYCPQENPLLGQLTARETLSMYCDLRGISPDAIDTHVTRLLAQVGLSVDADRQCGTLSGGTRRKLSLAIGLVGSPALLLLDEPSCGLDPVSRRQIWDVVLELRPKRSIVLTTHSMEESEALCTRVGVMVMGRLRCIGGLQHLKSKYGSGYMVELICPHRIGSAQTLVESLRSLQGVFSNACIVEDNGCRLRLTLPPTEEEAETASGRLSYQLADVFEGLKESADRLGIAEYAATQATLESVFLAVVHATERASSQDAQTLIIDHSASARGAYDRTVDGLRQKVGWRPAAPMETRPPSNELELM